MWKKILIPSLSIALLLVISAPMSSVNAENSRIVNWRIAGTIVQSIEVFSPQDQSFVGFHSLINLTAKGSPGPANITLLSKPTTLGTTGTSLTCKDGYIPIAEIEENDFVAIFPDQSLLFASIDKSQDGGGILCIDLATFQTTYFTVRMEITGGKGRFEGAGGGFTAEGYGYPGFSSEGTLVGENGTITGTIDFD